MTLPETTKRPVRPRAIKAPNGADWIEIEWQAGGSHKLPTELLRGYCPCAGCQGHSGPIRYTTGHDCRLRDLSQVGNYALKFVWGDGHDTGLFSYDYLQRLGDLHDTHGAALPELHPVLSRS